MATTPAKNDDNSEESSSTSAKSTPETAAPPPQELTDRDILMKLWRGQNDLKEEVTGLKEEMTGLKRGQDDLKRGFERLNKRTGILVEEKARAQATRMLGSDASERFLIKSIHDIVKLISKADDRDLRHDDQHARNRAVEKVVAFLTPLLPSVVTAAHRVISETSQDAVFGHASFYDAKERVKEAKRTIESGNQTTGSPQDTIESDVAKQMRSSCGKLLEAVKILGNETKAYDDESNESREKRIKMMTGTFKNKLERIKKAFVDSGNEGLSSCSGPGILLCCGVTQYSNIVCSPEGDDAQDVSLLKEWIEEKCNIFDFKEEIECDIRGTVTLVDDHATITCGEIKSSINDYGAAVKQINLRINVTKFVLDRVFQGRFKQTIRKGHLFVLECGKDAQQKEPTVGKHGASIFVHELH
jgi:hypothetical protein